MNSTQQATIQTGTLSDFARVMNDGRETPDHQCRQKGRLNLDQENLKNGLGQLVLTLIKLLHELLERQAIRRIDAGSLGDDQIEQVGVTLMRQAEEIDRLRVEFGLEDEDLNMDLGPFGKLL